MHMEINWPLSGSGSVILQSQLKKRYLQLQTTAVNCCPKIRLYSLGYKHKNSLNGNIVENASRILEEQVKSNPEI